MTRPAPAPRMRIVPEVATEEMVMAAGITLTVAGLTVAPAADTAREREGG